MKRLLASPLAVQTRSRLPSFRELRQTACLGRIGRVVRSRPRHRCQHNRQNSHEGIGDANLPEPAFEAAGETCGCAPKSYSPGPRKCCGLRGSLRSLAAAETFGLLAVAAMKFGWNRDRGVVELLVVDAGTESFERSAFSSLSVTGQADFGRFLQSM